MAFLFASKIGPEGKLIVDTDRAYSIAGSGIEQQTLIEVWSAYVQASARGSDNLELLRNEYFRIVALRMEYLRKEMANLYHIFINAVATSNDDIELVVARHQKGASLPAEVMQYSVDEFIQEYVPGDSVYRDAIHNFWLTKALGEVINTEETES